jgi:hypothetical protein
VPLVVAGFLATLAVVVLELRALEAGGTLVQSPRTVAAPIARYTSRSAPKPFTRDLRAAPAWALFYLDLLPRRVIHWSRVTYRVIAIDGAAKAADPFRDSRRRQPSQASWIIP